MLRIAAIVTLIVLISGCGEDDSSGSTGGGSGGASAGAAGVASGGADATAGTPAQAGLSGGGAGGATAGVAGGGSATGGSAAEPMGEALRQATYEECQGLCDLVVSVCPSSMLATCLSTCRQQADNYFSSGMCGLEMYRTLSCINGKLTSADVTCGESGPTYNGCQLEQATYYSCVGG